MNSSPRSDAPTVHLRDGFRTDGFRTDGDRRVWRAGSLLAAGLLAFGLTQFQGCADDLAEPTRGTVFVDLNEATTGAAEGARIRNGDEVVAEFGRETSREFRLPAGRHTLRIEKPCAAFSPQDQIVIDVTPGGDHHLSWSVAPEGGVAVTSSIPGARILLDGLDTGRVTPATLECVPSGEHQVAVELLGATTSGALTVQVGVETANVNFDFVPAPQARGAILELCTATLCPNCPPADEACNELTLIESLPDARFIAVECHSRWSGTDIFATPSSIARDAFLLGESRGNPYAIVNGSRSRRGVGAGNVEELVAEYRGYVEEFLVQESHVGLYWNDYAYTPGGTLSGKARLFAIDAPANWGAADLDKLELWALYYKDRLTWFHPTHGLTTYYHVIREYKKLGTMAELGIDEAGDWTDVPFQFDLSSDTRFTEEGMGLALFVHNAASKEVIQIVHRLAAE